MIDSTIDLRSVWRWAALTTAMSAGLMTGACSVEGGRAEDEDPRAQPCNGWAPGRCGRPSGCFADAGTCEDVYGGPKTCVDGGWSSVASCGDGGGACLPWASGRCGLPDGCFAEPGRCENIYGGPRTCSGGDWVGTASCEGTGGTGDGASVPLPAYGVGLDPGAMVNGANGHVWFHDPAIYDLSANAWRNNFELMQLSGAQYVRINFIRPAGFTDDAWLELYDPLVDELLEEGIIPYALVGREAVTQPFPDPWLGSQGGASVAVYNEPAQRSWIEHHYAPAFRDVVDHFGGRIQVFESFNEPDNWFLHGPDGLIESPKLRHATFALLLDEVYQEVKGGGAHGDVSLVTGPLVGHDHGGFSAAANYLRGAIDHGKSALGWGGSQYPFDGVGYHLYVAQDTGDGLGVRDDVASSIGAMHTMLNQELGAAQADTRGELWISELGWATPGVAEHDQRDALATTFEYLRGQSWRVRMAIWYQVGDTPSEGGFGLLRPHFMHSTGDPTRFKLSWTEFQEQAALAAP